MDEVLAAVHELVRPHAIAEVEVVEPTAPRHPNATAPTVRQRTRKDETDGE